MPLEPGCSDDVISRNIEHLIKAGHKPDQAAAIAHENCRRGKGYITPRPIGLLDQLRLLRKAHPTPGVTIKRGADGLRLMFIVTSNSYRDREREYITTKALARYVEKAWIADDVCDTGNTLRWWHSKGAIGDIVWADMEGPFLIEVAKERPDAPVDLAADDDPPRMGSIKAVWDYQELNPDGLKWGASHGFGFSEKRIDVTEQSATYDAIEKFETSTLPLSAAANSLTYSGVINMTERNDVLDKVIGQSGAADQLRKGVQQTVQVLEAQGVEHKAVDAEKVKALLDTLSAKADSFLGGLMDNPPTGLKEAIVKLVLGAVGESEPAADEPPADNAGDTTAMTDGGMMGGKAVQAGQVKLLDDLIQTQASLAAGQDELVKAIKGLTPLNTLAGEFQALRRDIETVKAQLAGRPKPASTALETTVEDAALQAEVEKQLDKRDPFWGTKAH